MVPAASLGIVDGRSLDRDDPHSALGQRFVEAEGVVVHLVELGLLEGVHAGSRLVDAVAGLDLAYLPRLEQLRVVGDCHQILPVLWWLNMVARVAAQTGSKAPISVR